MKPITLQDIFNAAWQKFIIEDAPPAATEGGRCAYLLPDGRKCAVGLVIPDGHPAQLQTEGSFITLINRYPKLWDKSVRTARGMDTFQSSLHDNLQKYGEWKGTLKERKQAYLKVAEEYGLEVPGEQRR